MEYEKKMNIIKDRKEYDYWDIFVSLPTEKIERAYNYLDENCTVCDYSKLVKRHFSVENVFMKLNKKYKMNPLIFYIESIRDINTLKIVKTVDLNWFPHMYPKFYDEKTYKFVEEATGKNLDRKCEFIPFP